MDTYSFLRELADSWALLALFVFFLGTWVWAWRPGSRALHDDAADVVFRHDDGPDAPAPACKGTCADCKRVNDVNFGPEGQS